MSRRPCSGVRHDANGVSGQKVGCGEVVGVGNVGCLGGGCGRGA